MKKVFKSYSKSTVIILFTLLSLASCKKKGADGSDSDKFPLTNLTLVITSRTINPASNSVSVAYDIKNTSSTSYTLEKYARNPIKVRITITTNDGTNYESSLFINNIQPNATINMEQVIIHAAGKTPDLTKTKAELIY